MAPNPKPTDIPRWAESADPTDVVNPGAGKRGLGWLPGEPPPHSIWNWWKRLAGQWFAYLDTLHENAITWLGKPTFTVGAAATVYEYAPAREDWSYTDATALYAGPTTTGLVLGPGANYWGSNTSVPLFLAARINCPPGATIQAVELLASNSDATPRSIGVFVYGRDGSGSGMTSTLYTSPDGDTFAVVPAAASTAAWRNVPLAVTNPVLPSSGYLGIYIEAPVTTGAAGVKLYAVRVKYAQPSVRPGV